MLVLEQHDQAGGCCHTFLDKGYEFDTGIHYIGEMAEGTSSRVLVDQLTEGRLDWIKLEDTYDTVVLGAGGQRREFPVPSGKGAWEKSLQERFPGEEKAIGRYFEMVREATATSGVVMGVMKLAPRWLTRLLEWNGVLRRMFPVVKLLPLSLQDVLDSLFSDPDLKAVLAYAFGDYGGCGQWAELEPAKRKDRGRIYTSLTLIFPPSLSLSLSLQGLPQRRRHL